MDGERLERCLGQVTFELRIDLGRIESTTPHNAQADALVC